MAKNKTDSNGVADSFCWTSAEDVTAKVQRLEIDNANLLASLKTANDRVEELEQIIHRESDVFHTELLKIREQLDAAKKDSEFAANQIIQWSVKVLPLMRAWRAMAVVFAPSALNASGIALLQRSATMIADMEELVK